MSIAVEYSYLYDYMGQEEVMQTACKWGHRFTCITDKVKGLWKTLREHTDLISSYIVTAIDMVFLAGKVFSSVPESVTKGAYTLLNFVGLISINFQLSLILKTYKDYRLARQAEEKNYTAMTAMQVVYVTSGVLFTLAYTGAAIAQDFQRQDIADEIYDLARTPGMVAIAVGIGLDLSYFFAYRQTAKDMERIHNVGPRQPVLAAIECSDSGEQQISSSEVLRLATHVRSTMDKYTLETLIKRLREEGIHDLPDGLQVEELMAIVDKNVQTQVKVETFLILLRVVGWGGMVVSRMWPYSLQQAAVDFGMSALYTGRLSYKKWRQAEQRQELAELQASDTELPELA